jgi:hypothetical protein
LLSSSAHAGLACILEASASLVLLFLYLHLLLEVEWRTAAVAAARTKAHEARRMRKNGRCGGDRKSLDAASLQWTMPAATSCTTWPLRSRSSLPCGGTWGIQQTYIFRGSIHSRVQGTLEIHVFAYDSLAGTIVRTRTDQELTETVIKKTYTNGEDRPKYDQTQK